VISAAPTPVISAAPPRSESPSIGYISLDESEAFVQAVSQGIRQSAATAGIDLVECDAGWTRRGVKACAVELAEAGVHGVISFQPFGDLADDVCAATGDAPTIGIAYDQGPCQVALLRVDEEAGRMAGAAMGQFASERWDCDVKAYVSLESGPDDPIGGARMQGYRDGYEEYCPLPTQSYTLTDAQHLITAQTQMRTLLEKIPGKPILVAGVSDIAILGALTAASAQDRQNHVWFSGQLADPAIRQTIACDDHYIGSVAQFPERFGESLVPALVDAMEGRDVPPRLEAELELVTSANVRQLFSGILACDG